MTKTGARVLATGFAVAALTLGAAGVAQATPVWVVPGGDLGPVLDGTTGVPGGLAPVFELFKFIGA